MTVIISALCIAVLVLLLMFIPLKVEMRGNVHNSLYLVLRYRYLLGLICWESRGERVMRTGYGEEDDYGWLPRVYHAAHTAGLWKCVWKLIRSLWGRVRVENVDVDLSVSLGDDYYTGTLVGYLIPLSLFINSRFGTEINLRPDFREEPLIEGYINADCSLLPVRVIWPLMLFYFSPPFQQARRIYYA